ncbi:MAG TPA: hypothetical protein VK654_02505 [Nitrospirota bacterium]|nr:hypothetical protein [Nitrospirota bacterium]
MAQLNKKTLSIGAMLALSFLGVLILIFSPVFGEGKNGLMYSDDMFNKLSKGSSYFIPTVAKNNEKFNSTSVAVALKFDKPEQGTTALKVLAAAGIDVKSASPDMTLNANLGAMMSKVLQDADDMYKNDGKKIADRYGMNEKDALTSWWNVLKVMDKELKKQGKIEESNIVSEVMKKAIEPSFNFYKIDAQQVSEKAGTMIGLLVFYVIYTMWWGFAIFYIFDGLGLTMKKAKVKKEV